MNKFLRAAVIFILVIASLLVAIALIEPDDVTVTRKTVIQAPASSVFAHISDMSYWKEWSSILLADSTAKITVSGTPGAQGNTVVWVGDEGRIGSGSIRNDGSEGTVMRYTFQVTAPGEMLADGTIAVKDSGLYSIVTWTFHKHFKFLANASLLMVDLDRYMGGDMESSLTNLKTYMEQTAEPVVAVTETEIAGYTIAGIRDTVAWDDLEGFFGDTYSLFNGTPAEKIKGPHVGMYYMWDTVHQRTDLMAGVVVDSTDIPVNGIIFSQLPAGKALMAVHKGGYGSMQYTHIGIKRYMQYSGQNSWLVLEEYLTYPGNEPDSNKWETRIYYLLQ